MSRIVDAELKIGLIVMEMEGLVGIPDARKTFLEIGCDSLGILEIQQQAEEVFGIQYTHADLQDVFTIADLAAVSLRRMKASQVF